MFFGNWWGLLRVIIVGVSAYASLIVLLRLSGKRTLSKMNAFDLVVTVALGSTLATVLLSKDVPLAEGVLAFALLIFLQFAIATLSIWSKPFRQLVKSEPALLFHKGEFLRRTMKAERVVEDEIYAAVRSQNFTSLEEVFAVVLETDGTFSVLANSNQDTATSLKNVYQVGAD